MAVTVDMRGILLPNGTSPTYASNYKNGDRGTGTWQLTAGHYQGYITPTIVYPRPDSETVATARHRINYTGQTYRIPVAVNGGAWPFYYELLAFPSGMTIGNQLSTSGGELIASEDYGIINYPNAVAGTYTVTVRVTDQNGVVNTVSWQLVVDTNNWVFLDPSAGTNGSGSLASPYNNLSSLTDQTTKKVLVRAGTLDLEQKVVPLDRMPKTYLPYNGESVTMVQALSPVGIQPNLSGDFWFSGFTFTTMTGRTATQQLFTFEGTGRTVFFENTFDFASFANTNGAPDNPAVLKWADNHVDSTSPYNAWYCVVMKNTFKNIVNRDMYIGYSMRYAVFERNSMQNCTTTGEGHGFYPKTSVDNFTFRGNFSIGTTNTQKLLRVDAYVGSFPMDYYDISYNNYRYYGSDSSGDGIGAISFASTFEESGSHHYVYRNTLYSQSAAAVHARGQKINSSITCSNNVMVCGGTNTNGVLLIQYDGTLTNTGYVAGNLAAGILDSSNKLAGGYVTNLGTKGAQVA